jgi:hypothetical protein
MQSTWDWEGLGRAPTSSAQDQVCPRIREFSTVALKVERFNINQTRNMVGR